MDKKLILVGLMGMNKDVINSKTAQLQAYEIKNFRLSATLDSNAFELTTERGTKLVQLYLLKDKGSEIYVLGTIIGYCILNDYLVLFTKDNLDKNDRIYRVTLNSNEFEEEITEIVILYEGDKLEFDTDRLIDAIPYYETELIQKVYWIDGKNQPRVINIANREGSNLPKQHINNDVDYDPYGFVLEIYDDYNSIEVTKSYIGGMFHAGVIQYAYSFFNENALETPVIDVTPLYYIAHEDRGEKPDTRVGCTFTLTLNVPIDFHDKFDYIRFYSIYRSALDTTPLVKVINEVETAKITPCDASGNIPQSNNLLHHYKISFVDDNTHGYVYDALLLLIRNNKIIPQTFNYKDGKLFFGNFKNDSFDKKVTNLESFVGEKKVHWETRQLNISTGNWKLLYDYKNQLKKNSREIRTFKGLEYYKLGILLLDIYGNWGEPILMGTYKNTQYPKLHNTDSFDIYDIPIAEVEWEHSNIVGRTVSDLYKYLELQTDTNGEEIFDLTKYVRVRPVVSFPNSSERNVLCQGVVNPTVFNLNQRVNGTLFAQSSWFYRPVPCVYGNTYEGTVTTPGGDVNQFGWGASYVLWRHNAPLFNTILPNGEALNMYTDEYSIYSEPGFSDDKKFTPALPDYKDVTREFSQYEVGFNICNVPFTVDGLTITGNCYKKQTDNLSDWYYSDEEGIKIGIVIDRKLNPYFNIQLYYFDGWNMNSILNVLSGGYAITYDEYIVASDGNIAEGFLLNSSVIFIFNSINGLYFNTPEDVENFRDMYNASLGYFYVLGTEILDEDFGNRPPRYADNISNRLKEKYEGFYFVDNQICTLNSPDIEFNTDIQNTDSENYKVKFVGISEFTNFNGKYNIIAENPLFLNNVVVESENKYYIRGTQLSKGFYDKAFNNTAFWGGQTVSALNCWFDDACNLFTWDGNVWLWNKDKLMKSYVVYPWQRKYLNNFNNNLFLIEDSEENDAKSNITEELPTSTIIKKILGNIKVGQTIYNIGNDSNFEEQCWDTNNTFLKQYNSEEPTLLKLTNDLYYSGNIDLLITSNSEYRGLLFKRRKHRTYISWLWDNTIGYPLILGLSKPLGDLDSSCGKWYEYQLQGQEPYGTVTTPNNRSTDPIWIRYKSSPHFVFDIGKEYSEQRDLYIERTLPIYKIELDNKPVFYPNSGYSNDIDNPTTISTIWNGSSDIYTPKIKTSYEFPDLQDSSDPPVTITKKAYNYLWIADIFKGTNLNTYTNDSSKSFENLNRLWIPCGDSYPFNPNNDSIIKWVEGDTFFLRYDCLKTYPFSNDDLQSVVEIGSFMLETRVNLDGRYDTNRGLMDNTAVTKENFNLINPVYSQLNNFFLYRILDDRFNNKETEYKNRITWTLDKLNGDDVDLWTRVTELGILDLDGDKGKVTKIERFDNNLYVFQDKGIAKLNYNDNIQIPTEGGDPIEVVNSGAINGKRYISENQGLQDKWCSKSTPYGVFFKDNYSKALCTLKYDERRNPIVAPLSLGSMLKWTELNIDDIYMVNYDNQANEVLFMIQNNEDYSSLSYSPLYQAFTAFYDYKDWVDNYNNSTISLLNSSSSTLNIYFLRRAADDDNNDVPIFNYFYGELKPYWINFTSVVDNYDCIFDNIYLKSNIYGLDSNSMNDENVDITLKGYDIYQGDTTIIPFDLIAVSNDKQAYELESISAPIWKDFKPIKKFGVWRGRIPRMNNSTNGKYLGSRIRNHWTRIGLKISSKKLLNKKTVVRDIKVDAFY